MVGRLIEQQQVRLRGERRGDREPLAPAAGERGGEHRRIVKTHPADDFGNFDVAVVGRTRGGSDDLANGGNGIEARILHDRRKAHAFADRNDSVIGPLIAAEN